MAKKKAVPYGFAQGFINRAVPLNPRIPKFGLAQAKAASNSATRVNYRLGLAAARTRAALKTAPAPSNPSLPAPAVAPGRPKPTAAPRYAAQTSFGASSPSAFGGDSAYKDYFGEARKGLEAGRGSIKERYDALARDIDLASGNAKTDINAERERAVGDIRTKNAAAGVYRSTQEEGQQIQYSTVVADKLKRLFETATSEKRKAAESSADETTNLNKSLTQLSLDEAKLNSDAQSSAAELASANRDYNFKVSEADRDAANADRNYNFKVDNAAQDFGFKTAKDKAAKDAGRRKSADTRIQQATAMRKKGYKEREIASFLNASKVSPSKAGFGINYIQRKAQNLENQGKTNTAKTVIRKAGYFLDKKGNLATRVAKKAARRR